MKLIQESMSIQEKTLSPTHRNAIAAGHRGLHQDQSTRLKIAKAMAGKANFKGKKHTELSKDRISHARGHYDPIGNKHWIVNASEKTYRATKTPDGYKSHRRRFKDFQKDSD